MAKSTGDQLTELKATLQEKAGNLKERIDTYETTKDRLLKELKAVTGKLEAVEKRLGKMRMAKKEYTKTLQETIFALEKIGTTAETMQNRFGKLAKVKEGSRVMQELDESKPQGSITDGRMTDDELYPEPKGSKRSK